MSKYIITPWESVKYGPFERNYPTAYICPHIVRTERLLFNKCFLGLPFYDELILDLTNITGIKEFIFGTSYPLGEKICYEGCILVSLKDNNIIHPNNDQELDPSWGYCDKFKTTCNNELWCLMKHWLAFELAFESIEYSTYSATANGLVKKFGEGFENVGYQTFVAVKKKIKSDANDHLEVMYQWMISSDCDWNIKQPSGACGEDDCIGPKTRRRTRLNFLN